MRSTQLVENAEQLEQLPQNCVSCTAISSSLCATSPASLPVTASNLYESQDRTPEDTFYITYEPIPRGQYYSPELHDGVARSCPPGHYCPGVGANQSDWIASGEAQYGHPLKMTYEAQCPGILPIVSTVSQVDNLQKQQRKCEP
eukprot:6471856-Amphidinium_carterae.1